MHAGNNASDSDVKKSEFKLGELKKSQHQVKSTFAQVVPSSVPIQKPITENYFDSNAIDAQSQMGRFGWIIAKDDVYYEIPYILRKSEKYFAIQMIEIKISQYLKILHPDLYTYYSCVKEQATQAEARLLNEINRIHCCQQFGQKIYTTESFLIKANDAYLLYEFLDTCYRKLSCNSEIISNKIGFIHLLNCHIVVPFVYRNSERYLPLFCFSNTNNIKIDFISGWDLSYLKFCCLYQGIWKRSCVDILAVVSLSDVMANLPNDTQFTICWPTTPDHHLLRVKMLPTKTNEVDKVICIV